MVGNWRKKHESENYKIIGGLFKLLSKSITNAQKTFSGIENPDKEIQALKKQLDEISKKITKQEVIKSNLTE